MLTVVYEFPKMMEYTGDLTGQCLRSEPTLAITEAYTP